MQHTMGKTKKGDYLREKVIFRPKAADALLAFLFFLLES